MKAKIFILEDDESIRDLYAYILDDNYDIRTFSSVKEFRAMRNEIPNIYILDVMFPDGNGLDMYRELQADPASAIVPVLMMSAHEDADKISGSFPKLIFLPKPFDIVELIDCVAKNIRVSKR